MTSPGSASAEAFNQYLPGKLIAASNGWKNLLVRIYSEPRVEESVIYPAVAEPRIVRILSGGEKQERGRGSWAFSSIYNESEYFDDMAMDTTIYAAVAALSKIVVQGIGHPVGPEADFLPLDLSFISSLCIGLFRATGPCNDL